MPGTARPNEFGPEYPHAGLPACLGQPVGAAPKTMAAKLPLAASAAMTEGTVSGGVAITARSGATGNAGMAAASAATRIFPAKLPARRLSSTWLPSGEPAPITATETGRNRQVG